MAAAAGIEDAVGIDLTMASDRQQRTEQVPSDTRLKGRQARRLSENEKTRISMYLRVLNMAVAALSAIFYTAKDKAVILFEIARTNGSNDILYLVNFPVFATGYLCSQFTQFSPPRLLLLVYL